MPYPGRQPTSCNALRLRLESIALGSDLAAVTRKDPLDLMLIDPAPAFLCRDIVNIHKARVQVTGKCKTFVKDKGHAIITVAGSMDDLSAQPNALQKRVAIFQLQKEIIILLDLNIGKRLSLEMLSEGSDKLFLTFRQDQFQPLIFEILDEPGVIGVEMSHDQIFELVERNAFALKYFGELWKCARPAAVNQ